MLADAIEADFGNGQYSPWENAVRRFSGEFVDDVNRKILRENRGLAAQANPRIGGGLSQFLSQQKWDCPLRFNVGSAFS